MLCKLSFKNIKKSLKDYAIYFFTLVLGISIFYLFNSIDSQTAMMNLSESEIQFLTTASRGQGLFVISQDTRLPIQIHLREEEKELFGNAGGR